MNSKRELEAKIRRLEEENRHLRKMEAWRDAACEQRDVARDQASRYRKALKELAKLYGFHDAYEREMPYCTGDKFDPGALIADLDAIDQARSADEARARLGIGGDREGE